MKRWILLLAMIVSSTWATAQSPNVTLQGIFQGPNGLPAANNVLTFTPSQTFFVAGEGANPGNAVYIFGNPTGNQTITQPAGGSGGMATLGVSGGAVNSCTVTAGGSGYPSPPGMVLSGGGGTGAVVFATITGGALSGCSVAYGGSGYTSSPTVNVVGGTSLAIAGLLDLSNSTVIEGPNTFPSLFGGVNIWGSGGSNTFNGPTTFNGINTFNVAGSNVFTIQNVAGDACINQYSVNGSYTTTSQTCADTTSPVSGQVNFNILETFLRGWYWNAPNSGNPIAMYLNGNGDGLTLTNNADVTLSLDASSGVVTNSFVKSVVSNGTAGEMDIGFLNAASYWRFVAKGNSGTVVQFSAKAPAGSLLLSDDGGVVMLNGACTTGTTTASGACWTSGAGAPGGSCTNGSLYTNTSGGAGTTTYECYSSGWHSIG